MLETLPVQEAIQKARRLAERKLADGMNADEFVEIAKADGFVIYVTAGKTTDDSAFSLARPTQETFLPVRELLGHKRIENTMKYTRLVKFQDHDFDVKAATDVEPAKELSRSWL